MTAINASGYGVIYLTPNQLLDISAGGAVSFDISTAKLSQRDWWDVWVTPYAENLALPFDDGEVDLAGMPRNAVHVSIESGEGAPLITAVRNGVGTTYNHGWDTTPAGANIVAGTNEAAVRQPFKITLSRTHIKVERLASTTGAAITFFDRDIADLGWSQGVVQFGHHSYNSTKCNDGTTTCGNQPNTWHWDNLTLSPSVPFTIIRGDRRFAEDPTQGVTFVQPAPANGMLRFSAIGLVEVSFDGGAFGPAQKQFATKNGDHPEHFSSYWTPMPAGARAANFRFAKDSWYQGPFMAKDFSIFSSGVSAGPVATSTPAATPTATATPPPSGTATAGQPATPTRPPTLAAAATPTLARTASPTPATAVPPTAARTATPTTVASSTPLSGPISGTWVSSATIDRPQAAPGSTVTVRAIVTSPGTGTALVDVELYDAAGQKVFQQAFDNTKFTAGIPLTFSVTYRVPATAEPGRYTVKIGVFKPGWGALYSWNNSAATVRLR